LTPRKNIHISQYSIAFNIIAMILACASQMLLDVLFMTFIAQLKRLGLSLNDRSNNSLDHTNELPK